AEPEGRRDRTDRLRDRRVYAAGEDVLRRPRRGAERQRDRDLGGELRLLEREQLLGREREREIFEAVASAVGAGRIVRVGAVPSRRVGRSRSARGTTRRHDVGPLPKRGEVKLEREVLAEGPARRERERRGPIRVVGLVTGDERAEPHRRLER